MLPTEHQEHETLEITHGWNEWFETGLYQFTNHQPGGGWMWVGTHIRPRVAVPERYHLPVGISLSTEIGYQRAIIFADTWTWEIRPIVDKKLGRWYSAFNPALDRAFHGPDTRRGLEFSPNFKSVTISLRRSPAGLSITARWVRSPASIRCRNRSSRSCLPST